MKKILCYLLSTIAVFVILGLGFFVGLQVYFNRFYYYTPELIGMSYSEVQKELPSGTINIVEEGQDFSDYPQGVIFKQEPLPEKVVKKGRNIKVWVSKGREVYKVPDFIGYSLIQVRADLEKAGVEAGTVAYINSNLPYNTIIATNPRVGGSLVKGQKLSFLVSRFENKAEVVVPELSGLTLDEAKDLLDKNGLILGNVTYMKILGLDPGIVVESSMAAKQKVSAGTSVDLTVSQ